MFLYSLLFRDNVPTIVLNQWEITADYLEDDLLDGVMPVLFADDVKAAEAAISEAPSPRSGTLRDWPRCTSSRRPWISHRLKPW
jgi:hypothetical protein